MEVLPFKKLRRHVSTINISKWLNQIQEKIECQNYSKYHHETFDKFD